MLCHGHRLFEFALLMQQGTHKNQYRKLKTPCHTDDCKNVHHDTGFTHFEEPQTWDAPLFADMCICFSPALSTGLCRRTLECLRTFHSSSFLEEDTQSWRHLRSSLWGGGCIARTVVSACMQACMNHRFIHSIYVYVHWYWKHIYTLFVHVFACYFIECCLYDLVRHGWDMMSLLLELLTNDQSWVCIVASISSTVYTRCIRFIVRNSLGHHIGLLPSLSPEWYTL